MKFDGHDHSWRPAHEPELRLRSARPLILALSLLAFAGLTISARTGRHQSPAPRAASTVAAAMLP